MQIKQTKIWRFFSSLKLVIWLLAVIAFFSLIGTLIPQNMQSVEYVRQYGHFLYKLLVYTGLSDLYSAWWFTGLLALLSLNLVICLINRFSLKFRFLGTMISHISILVILAGALTGIFYGEKGYVKIKKGETINSFVSNAKGRNTEDKRIVLDFSFRLDDFIYEENVDPEEKLLVYSKQGKLLTEVPFRINRQAEIAGTGYRIKILRYLPDFVMDLSTKQAVSRSAEPGNPAIEVELKGKDSVRTFWVFAAHPGIHQQTGNNFRFEYRWVPRRPKEMISKITVIKNGKEIIKKDIRVNFPLKFDGYTFFQSGHDMKYFSWSGLQVVKDPGLPVVYSGFILLILGLSIRFYINPLLKKTEVGKI